MKAIALVAALCLIGCSERDRESSISTTDSKRVLSWQDTRRPEQVFVPEPIEQLRAIDLQNKYNANELASDLKYKDKYVDLECIFNLDFGPFKDEKGNYYVFLNGGCAVCYFANSELEKAATIKDHDSGILRAKVVGKSKRWLREIPMVELVDTRIIKIISRKQN